MNVGELKNHLESMRDKDQILVEFPDLGTGGYEITDQVSVGIVEEVDVLRGRTAKVTITAQLL